MFIGLGRLRHQMRLLPRHRSYHYRDSGPATSVQGRGLAVLVAISMIIAASIIESSPIVRGTVIQTFNPAYYSTYIPNSGWAPCFGYDYYNSAVNGATGQVTSGYQDTESDSGDPSCSSSNTAERIHGGGFFVNAGTWSPPSSGNYYIIADWSWNIVQASAGEPNSCVAIQASLVLSVWIGVWDATSTTDIYDANSTALAWGANNNGWCSDIGLSVAHTFAGSSWSPQSGLISLSSSDQYQFRSNVNFATDTNCAGTCGASGTFADASFNYQATNYVWTLHWLEIVQ